jgi:exosortase D (VPLPA-CTERM-specific)
MAVCFFSRRVLFFLAVPFALLLFAVPIPQIVFNKVAFPLQLLATRAANAALVFFGISSQRNGNVIDLLTVNGSKVALEVAEACSGIRSLMLLLSLAVLFAYFTSEKGHGSVKTVREIFKDPNLWRTLILLLFMVPVALLTNATRVILTGIAAHYYGQEVLDSWWHDAFGWLSFGVAVLLLIAFNWGLTKIRILNGINFDSSTIEDHRTSVVVRTIKNGQIVTLVTMLVATGLLINYLQHRTPPAVERLSFSEFPSNISGAVRMRPDVRFDAETERVLGASDYIMRNYIEPPRKFNLYIGFYEAQKTGSTYHSPQNCLPGSGWVLSEGRDVQIRTTDGESFTAKQYVVQQRDNRQVMLYWYQGRGRTNSSEYSDKFYTILDSVRTGRTDGSIVRILTPVYADETDVDAEGAAKRFAANVYEVLSPFVPE